MPMLTLDMPEVPADLLDRLRSYFATDGDPPITASRDASGRLAFDSDTGMFMLRDRVSAALSEISPGWQEHHHAGFHEHGG